MIRLAAVLAEIAQNEANCASTMKSGCAAGEKVEREGENPLGRQRE